MATITKFEKFADLTRQRWSDMHPCIFAIQDAINAVEQHAMGVTGIHMAIDEETQDIEHVKFTVTFNCKRPFLAEAEDLPVAKAIKNELGSVMDDGDQWLGADVGTSGEDGVQV